MTACPSASRESLHWRNELSGALVPDDPSPIPVAVTFSLSPEALAQIADVSPRVRLLDYPAAPLAPGEERPAPDRERARQTLAQAEVIFGSHLDPLVLFDSAPNLRWFQVLTAGLDELIAQGILERDFVVTTASGVGAVPIAEYCIGVMVMLEKGLHTTMRDQVEHRWEFGFRGELKGKTCGIVGLGAIGRELARRARAFGMRIVATRRSATPGAHDPDADVLLPFTDLPQLLSESDYVVLCVPLTAETQGMVGAAELALMKPGAAIVNIARAAVVDQEALLSALREERLGGAALDVHDPEPLPPDSPFWDMPNVIVTPHRSGAVYGYLDRAAAFFAANLERYVRGQPLENVVERDRGY